MTGEPLLIDMGFKREGDSWVKRGPGYGSVTIS
jgi:hypothetical protein